MRFHIGSFWVTLLLASVLSLGASLSFGGTFGHGIATARSSGCGTVEAFYPDTEGGVGARITSTHGISCHGARKVVKKCIRHYRVRGWHARTGSSPYRLVNGRKVIRLEIIAGASPHCF